MYPSVRPNIDLDVQSADPADENENAPAVPANVIYLGLTSLFTDVSSEMVTAILPIYLVTQLRFEPFEVGLFLGLQLGIAGLASIAGGVMADRRQRYKEVAGAGYAVSAACKLGLLAAGNSPLPASAALSVDRIGKGARSSSRDALISLSARPSRLGTAFGVHRAFDTVGAVAGPIVVFAVLRAAPDAYDAVFVVSFLVALIGLGVLVLFVQNRSSRSGAHHILSRASASALLARDDFRTLVIAGSVLGVFTIADAFVYLTVSNHMSFQTQYFPLLYVGTAISYLVLAVPLGHLADRVGRSRIFLTGYVLLALVYVGLLNSSLGALEVARDARAARCVLRGVHRRRAVGHGEHRRSGSATHDGNRHPHHGRRGQRVRGVAGVRRDVVVVGADHDGPALPCRPRSDDRDLGLSVASAHEEIRVNAAPAGPSTGTRTALFIALVVICGGIGAVYVLHAAEGEPGVGASDAVDDRRESVDAASIMSEPHVLFRNTDLGPDYGRVEVVPLSDPGGPRVTPLSCQRVAMAGGVGVCGVAKVGAFTSYEAEIFDTGFNVEREVPLAGPPNRARVSPDGKWASVTAFVHGDSYASDNFSTRATFIDTANGHTIGNLEQFRVTQDGHVVQAISRNYWGVTFAADSDHFYATQAVGADIHLIEGQVSTRRARTLASDVECPALSPDQTRIVYKKRSGGGLSVVHWRLHVLDLRTGVDHALAETRSVDDQVEWLDNQTVLYSIPRPDSGAISDIWSVSASGTGTPKVFIAGASSPSVFSGR